MVLKLTLLFPYLYGSFLHCRLPLCNHGCVEAINYVHRPSVLLHARNTIAELVLT